jgi:RNA-directed DNA polymerase
MPIPAHLARALAAVFLDGDQQLESLVKRSATLLGKRWRWLRPLAKRFLTAFANQAPPRLSVAARFINNDSGFCRACETHEIELVFLPPTPATKPVTAARAWNLPILRTVGELAVWLRVSLRELEWFADARGLLSKENSIRLQHYHQRILSKRGGQVRLIEAPKERLKAIQRQLLIEILEPVPVHDAAHGFCAGRSIQSFAAPHVGQRVVLKLDLQDFFPSITAARVSALFRALGYPETVADLLTGLCTTITPLDVWESANDISRAERRRVETLYGRRHLPQGAPTSPALANLCTYRLDCRLAALASRAGGRYTRYADDLAFSGGVEFARRVKRLRIYAASLALEEGFAVHHRKTRIMPAAARQKLAGLIVNDKLNIRRNDYDQLKAILTNCARHGAATQNREQLADFRAHLLGRISFVQQINPQRGARLRDLFGKIEW